jgi:hypothetical protein
MWAASPNMKHWLLGTFYQKKQRKNFTGILKYFKIKIKGSIFGDG